MSETIWVHLLQLKNMVLKVAGIWIVGMIAASFFNDQLFNLVLAPIPHGVVVLTLAPTDRIMLQFKVWAMAGFVMAFPFILFFLWQFLAPAFNFAEKKFISLYVFAITLLAFSSVVYGYVYIIPTSIQFLVAGVNIPGIQAQLTAIDYVNFLVFLFAALIIVFQTPLLIFSLIKSGLVPKKVFEQRRREAYLGALVIMSIITPTPDLFTLALIMMPIIVFYEAALIASSISFRRKSNVVEQIVEEVKELEESVEEAVSEVVQEVAPVVETVQEEDSLR